MEKILPKGKGLYVWNIVDMPPMWIDKFLATGITWIAVKVANGVNSSNLRKLSCGGTADDILGPFIASAKMGGMNVLGWQYVYGFNPLDEAEKAAQRVEKFELDGFIIDAEHQYKGKHSQARSYSEVLRMFMPDTPIGLSTYRFPLVHPRLPYKEFLDVCDFNAPQVYWNHGKAGSELLDSHRQYAEIKDLPFIPAGRAYYGEGFPKPTPMEIKNFLQTAQSIDCPAAFFWSADALYHRVRPLPEIREAIAGYEWVVEDVPVPEPEPPVEEPSVEPGTVALNRIEIQIDEMVFENNVKVWLSKKE